METSHPDCELAALLRRAADVLDAPWEPHAGELAAALGHLACHVLRHHPAAAAPVDADRVWAADEPRGGAPVTEAPTGATAPVLRLPRRGLPPGHEASGHCF